MATIIGIKVIVINVLDIQYIKSMPVFVNIKTRTPTATQMAKAPC